MNQPKWTILITINNFRVYFACKKHFIDILGYFGISPFWGNLDFLPKQLITLTAHCGFDYLFQILLTSAFEMLKLNVLKCQHRIKKYFFMQWCFSFTILSFFEESWEQIFFNTKPKYIGFTFWATIEKKLATFYSHICSPCLHRIFCSN